MDFISDGTWWTFFLVGIVIYFFQRFYKPFMKTGRPNWALIISASKLFLVLIAFFVFGWKGGVGIIVALYLLENTTSIIISAFSSKIKDSNVNPQN
ncbi:MAG: hypothetical protein H8E46_09250 [FCB group bacterium]|nr:hypothetical protein [FCB group bacterium]